MSFNTPVPGQRWVNNLTKDLVFVDEIVVDEDEGVRPQLVYRDFNNKDAMDLDQFVRDFSLYQLYVPGPDHSLNVQEVRGKSKEFYDVNQFHQKFELLHQNTPGHLTKRKLMERIEFLQEELDEFVEACGIYPPNVVSGKRSINYEAAQDLSKQADALVDLVYVALGTAVMLGLPWEALWDDVQRANMAKERGVTHRGHAVDVKKPKGWIGPQGQAILEKYGYNPNEWPGPIVKSNMAVGNFKEERDDANS